MAALARSEGRRLDAFDQWLEVTRINFLNGIRMPSLSGAIGECLGRVEAGGRMALDSLILAWLSREPGFCDVAPDPDADVPLHVFVAQGRAHDRWCAHLGGLTGNLTGASRLRQDLCPGADCWLRYSAGTGRYAAAVLVRHHWHEASALDEASAMIGATLTAYEAGKEASTRRRQEAPRFAVAAE